MPQLTAAERLPHWDLDSIYPGLESEPFKQALAHMAAGLDELAEFLLGHQITEAAPEVLEVRCLATLVEGYLQRMSAVVRLYTTLRLYIWCILDTDSSNEVASRQLSVLDRHNLRITRHTVQFQAWLGRQPELQAAISSNEMLQAHSLWLLETAEQSRYLMSEAEESLAAELALSGLDAWSQLHQTIWAKFEVPFERDGKTERLPMPAIQNMALNDPDADVRRRAAEAEVAAWADMREPLTAALNGVIGTKITLNKRRGRKDPLHAPLDQARISRDMLDTLWASIQDCLPMFHRLWKAKAAALSKESLAWWDALAPLGQADRRFTYPEAQGLILAAFDSFSPDLGDFARRAFDGNWIDAEPRAGKQGGAYCNQAPGTGVSRVLCNFDGSLDQVLAIGHELGHAFHTHCQTGKTFAQCRTPMTLAESASLFCESLVTDRALANADSPDQELAIVNAFLGSTVQNILWPLFLYGTESEVYERRERSKLSADELCEIAERIQARVLGNVMDPAHHHPYFWAGMPHLFLPLISFYNFPYPFGMLFSLGLYAQYQQRGAAFVSDYRALLVSTGEATPLDLAMRFGIDLRQRNFWQASLGLIERRIERFEQLCAS